MHIIFTGQEVLKRSGIPILRPLRGPFFDWLNQIISTADKALYKAKENGRNKVEKGYLNFKGEHT